MALELAKEHNEGRGGKHREAAAKELVKLYTLLDSSWRDWSKKKHEIFRQGVEKMMAHYAWLANDAMIAGKHLWSLVQKSHLILHLAEQSYMHPSLTWTYGSESYMGFIVQMAASCTHGTPAYKAPEKVCQTFRMMFHLYLKGYIAMEEA